MVAKILLQELTRAQIGWDETVSQTFQKIWDSWIKQLKLLSHFRLGRCIKPARLDVVKVVELHHFSDASEKGYGTVTYIRMLDRTGRIYCSLLCSKSRVAPIKSVSIPRLELSAAALAVKVNHTVLNALDLMVNRVRYWTDSTAVLKYIRNVTARFHVFVANRIAIIHDGSDPNQWRYVCSKNNPADFVSRGQGGADFVKNYTWKNGPEFLWDNEKTWPEHAIDSILETNDPEVKRVTLAAGTIKIRDSELMSPVQKLINHYSSWWNLTRAVAWLLRIKSVLVRRERQFRILQVQDIADAERLVLIQEQDKYFKREKLDLTTGTVPKRSALCRLDPKLHNGLLCVGGRLRNSALPPPTKHPIILPSKGRVTELLIRKVHEDIGHGGRQQILSELRKSYWIIKGNSAVRRVIGECFHCRRLYGQAKKQKMADLPPERVNPIESPFSSTGIDLFGPFFCQEGSSASEALWSYFYLFGHTSCSY